MSGDLSWHPNPSHYLRAQQWARDLLARTDWVILDTETTGLDSDAEAVQIGVVDPKGNVLLSCLLHPTLEIPLEATRIHGITNEMVAQAPTFPLIRAALGRLLAGKTVVIYNADYDSRILYQTASLARCKPIHATWSCAMNAYAAFVGEWNEYHGNYRWQRLPTGKHPAHDAVGDCLATLDLIRKMANWPDGEAATGEARGHCGLGGCHLRPGSECTDDQCPEWVTPNGTKESVQ